MLSAKLAFALTLCAISSLSATACPPGGCPASMDDKDEVELLQKQITVDAMDTIPRSSKSATMSPPMVKNMKNVTVPPLVTKNERQDPKVLSLLESQKSKKSRRVHPDFEGTGKNAEVAASLSNLWKGEGGMSAARTSGPFRTTIGASMEAGASLVGQMVAGHTVDPMAAAVSVGLPALSMACPMLGMAVSIAFSFVSGFLGSSGGSMNDLYVQIIEEVGDMIQTQASKLFLEQHVSQSVSTLKDILDEMDWIPNMLDQISSTASPARYMGCFDDAQNVALDSAVKISTQSGRNNPEACMEYCEGYVYVAAYQISYSLGMYGCACFDEWKLTSTVEDSQCSPCLNSDLDATVYATTGSFTAGTLYTATGGVLTGGFSIVDDHVELQIGDIGSTITFNVMCESMGYLSFQAEHMSIEAGRVSALQFFVDGAYQADWRFGASSDWEWSIDSPTKIVAPGLHQVKLRSYTNGIKLKRLQFPEKRSDSVFHSSCFFHAVHNSSAERSVLAASATVNAPWENRGSYVQYPEGVGNNEGSIVFEMMCMEASDLIFVANAINPNGQSDSYWLSIDTQAEQKWVTGQSSVWAWTNDSPSFTVSAGVHTVKLRGREDGSDIRLLKLQDGYGTQCVFHSSHLEFEFVGRGLCTSAASNLQEGLTMAECQSACDLDDVCMGFEFRLGQCKLHTSFMTVQSIDVPDSQCWRKVAAPPQRCGLRRQPTSLGSVHAVYEIFTPMAMKAERDQNMELSYYAMFQNDLATAKSAFWYPECVEYAEALQAGQALTLNDKENDYSLCKQWQEMGTYLLGINHAHEHLMTLLNIAIIKPSMRESILERFRTVGSLYLLLARDSIDTLVAARGAAISSADNIRVEEKQGTWIDQSRIRGGSRRRSSEGGCKFSDTWGGATTEIELNTENCGEDFNLGGGCCHSGDWETSAQEKSCMNTWVSKVKECRTHYYQTHVDNITSETESFYNDLALFVNSAG